jgi:peptidoglycan/xylan/chitin deacetylase (PgdA/CDA1 family)
VQLSAALHAGSALGMMAAPESWPMLLSLVAADHIVLAGAGMVPGSALLGPNLSRLPASAVGRGEVALTFDDGPDPRVTPRVLDILRAFDARATFFCVGTRAAAHPEVLREIVARGHCVENHTQRHSRAFAWYGWRTLCREIAQSQDTLAGITGVAPRFFRAPFGVRSPLLDPALSRAGLRLVSWTRRGYDAVDANPERVLARLTHALAPGLILLLHDGVATGTSLRESPVLSLLPWLLEALAVRKLRTVTLRQATGLAA